MITLFKQHHIWDAAQKMILHDHIYRLPFDECVRQYPDPEIIESHPGFTINKAVITASECGFTLLVMRYSRRAKKNALYRAFRLACSRGHVGVVKHLIRIKQPKRGGNVYANKFRALKGACRAGHFPIIKMIIERYPELKHKALRPTCESGNVEAARYLIEIGADVKSQWEECFHAAIRSGSDALVSYLLTQTSSQWNSLPQSQSLLLRTGTRGMVTCYMEHYPNFSLDYYDQWDRRDIIKNIVIQSIYELIPRLTMEEDVLTLLDTIATDQSKVPNGEEMFRYVIRTHYNVIVTSVDKVIAMIIQKNNVSYLKCLQNVTECGTGIATKTGAIIRTLKHYLRTDDSSVLCEPLQKVVSSGFFSRFRNISQWCMSVDMMEYILSQN